MELRIAAGIVTFNPDIERLKENINSLSNIKYIEKIVIVDNFSSNITDISRLITNYSNIEIIKNTENQGIARALNQIFDALPLFDWVLTCDQDSIVPCQLFDVFTSINKNNLGILCPAVYDLNTGHVESTSSVGISEIEKCITSGSLTCRKAWETIHGFDEIMFIDSVDFDFCIRLRNEGYKILQANEVFIKHEIGKRSIHKFLFWEFCVMNHSAFRKYYMMRNRFYCDYKHHGKIKYSSYLSFLKTLLFVIFYENDKKNKIKRMVKGKNDGCRIGKEMFKK